MSSAVIPFNETRYPITEFAKQTLSRSASWLNKTKNTLVLSNLGIGCIQLAEGLSSKNQFIIMLAAIHIFTGVQILVEKKLTHRTVAIICNASKFLWLSQMLILGTTMNQLDDGLGMMISLVNIMALADLID